MQDGSWPGKMKSMRISLSYFSLFFSAVVASGSGSPKFIGVEKCKPCHLPEYQTWSQSAHAMATEAAKASEGFQAECLACHATTPDGSLPGVQCEACHGPGSEYWPVPVMVSREKAVAAGLLLPGKQMCARCHDGQDHHKPSSWEDFKHDHREIKQAVELP